MDQPPTHLRKTSGGGPLSSGVRNNPLPPLARSANGKNSLKHLDFTSSATAELRRNPALSAPDECARACRENETPRICYYHFTWNCTLFGSDNFNVLQTVLMILLFLKYIYTLSLLCKECEDFFSCVNDVDVFCNTTLRTKSSEKDKQFYKNILRINRVEVTCYRLYGFFNVDAMLIFNFLGIVATYLIAILQFTVL
ncbi:hypothetical protein evm_010761 [Chilo suppressalis]|nr:hypothetical protein evm_010761 [Chilo suppressalis]